MVRSSTLLSGLLPGDALSWFSVWLLLALSSGLCFCTSSSSRPAARSYQCKDINEHNGGHIAQPSPAAALITSTEKGHGKTSSAFGSSTLNKKKKKGGFTSLAISHLC
jgi:hypothetical protein